MIEKNYSIREAAEVLGIKVRTVREWLRRGIVHGKKYENCPMWFIPESEIKRLQKDMR